MIKYGLNPTPTDENDFHFGGLTGITTLPDLSELPASFRYQTLGVKDQRDSDFCSAFSSDLLDELMTGVELCPEWGFAASKALSGDVDTFGQDIRTALKRHLKAGALAKSLSPYSLESKNPAFLRRIENWPDLSSQASAQADKSFFKITGQYDHYDNIRATIGKFKDVKQAVVFGMEWHWPISQVVLDTAGSGEGHMIACIGWEENGLVLQNSAGLAAGQNGCHIMTREVVNSYVEEYGAYTLVPLSPEEARAMLAKGIKLEDNVFTRALKELLPCLRK